MSFFFSLFVAIILFNRSFRMATGLAKSLGLVLILGLLIGLIEVFVIELDQVLHP
jgi:hypothetical protein